MYYFEYDSLHQHRVPQANDGTSCLWKLRIDASLGGESSLVTNVPNLDGDNNRQDLNSVRCEIGLHHIKRYAEQIQGHVRGDKQACH
jgi:hypothetical protein